MGKADSKDEVNQVLIGPLPLTEGVDYTVDRETGVITFAEKGATEGFRLDYDDAEASP